MLGLVIALLVLTGNTVLADGNEQYIVYLKRPMLMSLTEDNNRNYQVVSKKELNMYLEHGLVEFYEPDEEIILFDGYEIPIETTMWNHNKINLSKAWKIGCYGNDIRVGVIDSGVYAHSDLQHNLLTGHNYLNDSSDTTDNIGHGTFVSGIIAAEANGQYIDGIAHKAKIVPLKCFDNDYQTTVTNIADAIYDAIDVYDCDVINMSFGMTGSSTTLKNAIEYAQENGCILTASAGNDGNTTINYPANYDGVIGVGAVDSKNSICYFSQRNRSVDVVAPGSELESVSISTFKNNSGTSFSAPHVTAMAAIAKCIDKNITSSEFNTVLQETSTDLGAVGYDTFYGYGLINVEKMIDKLLEDTPYFMSPILENSNEISVTIYNNSNENLSAEEITGSYEDGKLLNLSINDADILKGDTKTFKTAKQENVKFMLWKSLNNLMPLFNCREYSDIKG